MSHKVFATCLLGLSLISSVASAKAPNRYEIDSYPPGYTSDGKGGYVYVAPSYGAVPPVAPYGYGAAYGYGYYGTGYTPAPLGFGNPYYNGYNDPNYGLYGPGVREFLHFGGADFYGW